jgi:transposase
MDVCILNQEGELLVHRHMPAGPDPFLKPIAPYRAPLGVCVACLFTWYGLADLCAREDMPFVLGHALYMKALQGGKATNDRSDAQQIAVLFRGSMLPQAYVYPAAMRATRALLRRRLHLMRKRATLLTPIQNTTSQYNVPEIGKKNAYKANRDGVAERVADPAVQKSIEVALALLDHAACRLRDMALTLLKTAKQHEANTLSLRRTVPGIGALLSLVWLDDIHDIHRFPRVQDVVSYCRLVKCAKASAGKRDGTSRTTMDHAYLKWASSEAAVLFLRANPAGQQSLTRLEKKHSRGKAVTVLAHK